MSFSDNAMQMIDALERTPGWPKVAGDLDRATLEAILGEAAKLAEDRIAPLNEVSDRVGATFSGGKVQLPRGFREGFDALAEGGWLGIEQPEELGGMGLPISAFVASDLLFERACPALMMAATASRSAALLLTSWAPPDIRDDWVPALLAGERCATICISEPEAGSDLGRIRTRATLGSDGWQVSGQKIWISFGEHDLRDRIGHCLLARTGDEPGTRGLSLFFVERGPGVACERIEEKLGLHGSPTCALRFEDAPAVLIGEEGRGLPQLFTMIRHMRLQVACQGLGTALGVLAVAREHAKTRRQGGNPKEKPVPIIEHPDVRRQLDEMEVATDLFRLVLVQTTIAADLSADDPAMARLCALLLPLIKNFGAELGFDTAAKAILVLGGSGFTTDYPVEQALRDARVFAIYEGTTGMQAQDFLLRQSLAENGLALFQMLDQATTETAPLPKAEDVIARFRAFFEEDVQPAPRAVHIALAEPAMRAGWIAVQAWMCARASAETSDAFLATARPALEHQIARARLEARRASP